MSALEECLNECQPMMSVARRNLERETCLKAVLDEMCTFLLVTVQSGSGAVVVDDALSMEVRERAIAVIYSLSAVSFAPVFVRCAAAISAISIDGDMATTNDMTAIIADLELVQHVHMDKDNVTKLIKECTVRWPFRKEHMEAICALLSTVIWNWIDGYPEEYSTLQHKPQDELSGSVN
jgi:neurofibromin 1